ncbi:hypothetical protein AB0D91_46000 [Streptomyces canus]|uniref:hypothetical protein n=1 Tax=Streptomyces canus TaxID=58343 RepID=UPI0033EDA20B
MLGVVVIQELADVDGLVGFLVGRSRVGGRTRLEPLREASRVVWSRGMQFEDLVQVPGLEHREVRLSRQIPHFVPHLGGELRPELWRLLIPRSEELFLQLWRIEQETVQTRADLGCNEDVACGQLVHAQHLRREDLNHLRKSVRLAKRFDVVLALAAVPLASRTLGTETGRHVCSTVSGSTHPLHPDVRPAFPQADRMNPLDCEVLPASASKTYCRYT